MSTAFISHASEDKDEFVRPLVKALKGYGIKVWYDELILRPGDSLRRSIDQGLVECTAGIVIISPNFFRKQWTQRELDALFTSEISGKTRLIPIWHKVGANDVAAVSAFMADRVAIKSDIGIDEVAYQLSQLLPTETVHSNQYILEKIESFQLDGDFGLEAIAFGCKYRLFKILAILEEHEEVFLKVNEKYLGTEIDFSLEDENFMLADKVRLLRKFEVPEGVYLEFDALPVNANIVWCIESLELWVSGAMTQKECSELFFELDIYLDVDYLYVLFGIPNFTVNGAQREILDRAILAVGTWLAEGDEEIEKVYSDLAIKNM